MVLTDDSGQVFGLAPSRTRHSAAAATSADQQQLPLSRRRPKLIEKARPATNGIRTSTKYRNENSGAGWESQSVEASKRRVRRIGFLGVARIDGGDWLG